MTFSRTFIFLILISLVSCVRSYKFPSESMCDTFQVGEVVAIKKTSAFKRNEIVVFKVWAEDYTSIDEKTGKFRKEWQNWIKRLIAVSGDTIRIKDGDVYINGQLTADPPTSLSEYEIISKVLIDDLPKMEAEYTRMEKQGELYHYFTFLTTEEAEEFRNRRPAVTAVKKTILPPDINDTILIKPFLDQWSPDNFGPIYIPQPGDTINVNPLSKKLYQQVPGIEIGQNIIKEKLYFVMGDNRHRSMDSRYIGFITHSKMFGVVK